MPTGDPTKSGGQYDLPKSFHYVSGLILVTLLAYALKESGEAPLLRIILIISLIGFGICLFLKHLTELLTIVFSWTARHAGRCLGLCVARARARSRLNGARNRANG